MIRPCASVRSLAIRSRTRGCCSTRSRIARSRTSGPTFAAADNERLEFLGDAVVGLVVASLLYVQFPDADEGELTRRRADLVSEKGLSEAAEAIGVGDAMRLGKGEEKSGGRAKPRLLASALEACVGAVYSRRRRRGGLHGSLAAFFEPRLHTAGSGPPRREVPSPGVGAGAPRRHAKLSPGRIRMAPITRASSPWSLELHEEEVARARRSRSDGRQESRAGQARRARGRGRCGAVEVSERRRNELTQTARDAAYASSRRVRPVDVALQLVVVGTFVELVESLRAPLRPCASSSRTASGLMSSGAA